MQSYDDEIHLQRPEAVFNCVPVDVSQIAASSGGCTSISIFNFRGKPLKSSSFFLSISAATNSSGFKQSLGGDAYGRLPLKSSYRVIPNDQISACNHALIHVICFSSS